MKLSLYFLAAIAFAQSGMAAPAIGAMRDALGLWRPVQGVAGNFVLGEPAPEPEPWPASRNSIEERNGALFIVAPDGSTVGALPPEAQQPILLLDRDVLYATGEELVFGAVRVPCSGVTALRRMSEDWVQVSAEDREYALRIEAGREALYVLPAAPLPAAPRPEVRRR